MSMIPSDNKIWLEKIRRLEVLIDRFKSTTQATKDFISFMEHRCSVEEEFFKSLSKTVTQSGKLKSDDGMLKVYLTSSCDMLERIGGKHHAFAVKVKDIFVDPMKAFAEYQKKARKTAEATMEKTTKTLKQDITTLEKWQRIYDDKYQTLMHNTTKFNRIRNGNVSQKDYEKAYDKSQKSMKEKDEYKKAIAKLKSSQTEWDHKMYEVYTRLSQVDGQRILLYKKCFKDVSKAQADILGHSTSACYEGVLDDFKDQSYTVEEIAEFVRTYESDMGTYRPTDEEGTLYKPDMDVLPSIVLSQSLTNDERGADVPREGENNETNKVNDTSHDEDQMQESDDNPRHDHQEKVKSPTRLARKHSVKGQHTVNFADSPLQAAVATPLVPPPLMKPLFEETVPYGIKKLTPKKPSAPATNPKQPPHAASISSASHLSPTRQSSVRRAGSYRRMPRNYDPNYRPRITVISQSKGAEYKPKSSTPNTSMTTMAETPSPQKPSANDAGRTSDACIEKPPVPTKRTSGGLVGSAGPSVGTSVLGKTTNALPPSISAPSPNYQKQHGQDVAIVSSSPKERSDAAAVPSAYVMNSEKASQASSVPAMARKQMDTYADPGAKNMMTQRSSDTIDSVTSTGSNRSTGTSGKPNRSTFARRSIKMEGWAHVLNVTSDPNPAHAAWKRQWCALEGGYIWFFEDPSDNNKPQGLNRPQGMVHITKAKVYVEGGDSDPFHTLRSACPAKHAMIGLQSSAKQFGLGIDSAEEYEFWLSVLPRVSAS